MANLEGRIFRVAPLATHKSDLKSNPVGAFGACTANGRGLLRRVAA